MDDYENILKKLMHEMNQNQQNLDGVQPVSSSVEVPWTLSELESIVYDFVNFNPKRQNQEFLETALKPSDVQKEDLMKIQKVDKKMAIEQPLPQMIREYILHDRGNSIFLGDSFANLPSPVGEGMTIKNLFKFNEDDDDNERKLERENKEKNEIKIEGKPDKGGAPTKAPEKKEAKSGSAGQDIEIDLEEIDRIVFQQTSNENKHDLKKQNMAR